MSTEDALVNPSPLYWLVRAQCEGRETVEGETAERAVVTEGGECTDRCALHNCITSLCAEGAVSQATRTHGCLITFGKAQLLVPTVARQRARTPKPHVILCCWSERFAADLQGLVRC